MQDAGTAKKLAFSREVGQRCITLEGDDFNPSGLLTGGSRAASRSLLNALHDLGAQEAELAGHKEAMEGADRELRALAGAAKEHRRWAGGCDAGSMGTGGTC